MGFFLELLKQHKKKAVVLALAAASWFSAKQLGVELVCDVKDVAPVVAPK